MTNDTAVLEVTNLSVRYGGVHAVRDFNLTLRPGERVALIGPNGAGKSTVMNSISGHLSHTSGDIRLRGVDISRSSAPSRARAGVSRTFQNLELFGSMSVLDNVMVALETQSETRWRPPRLGARAERRRAALDALALFGIDSLAHQEVSSLSYGLCKLLELSRALALKPPLLLLDEPVAGLSDSADFVRSLAAAIDSLDTTVLLVEHDMASVKTLCERVHVLDTGVTIAEGTFEEVTSNPRVIEAYLGTDERLEPMTDSTHQTGGLGL
jgi:ABC-type branched-subunit amino acid transport system ATPase component